jgi:DNA-binding GntR family transcriptional regulator
VRAVLAALEAGAEARDAAAMKEHVSERYRDARGQDRRAVAALVAFHFLRNRSVHLLVRVRAVEIAPPGEARVDAVVAMAGVPIATPEALVGLRADLYRFELRLREEDDGAWRVVSADWHPARVEDFD